MARGDGTQGASYPCRRPQIIDCLLHRWRDMKQLSSRRLDEMMLDAVVDHRQQRIEIPRDVKNYDRLVMIAKLPADDDLEDLLERAEAAGEGDERIGPRFQQRLALAHG